MLVRPIAKLSRPRGSDEKSQSFWPSQVGRYDAMIWMKLYFNINNKTVFFSIYNIVIVILDIERSQKAVKILMI